MGKKIKISVSVDEDLLKWVDDEIKVKRFANRSHAFENALQRLKNKAE